MNIVVEIVERAVGDRMGHFQITYDLLEGHKPYRRSAVFTQDSLDGDRFSEAFITRLLNDHVERVLNDLVFKLQLNGANQGFFRPGGGQFIPERPPRVNAFILEQNIAPGLIFNNLINLPVEAPNIEAGEDVIKFDGNDDDEPI